jgi:adenylate kinase
MVPAGAQFRPAQITILIGPPGSGKSVQARLLSKSHKVPAISMASLLKEEMGKKTPLAKALASSLASGELVSDDAANEVMKARLLRRDTGRGFILDGYPTTEKQARALDDFLAEHSFPKPIVVVLEAPDQVLRKRMKSRGRADDTPENIERRIREYRDLETFTEKWYGSGNTVRVDGTGTVQSVAASIAQQIESAQSKKGLTVRPQQGDGLKQRLPATSP